MNKAQRDIRRKTRVLEHAARIGNVRKTCHFEVRVLRLDVLVNQRYTVEDIEKIPERGLSRRQVRLYRRPRRARTASRF